MHNDWRYERLDNLGLGTRPVLKAGPFGSNITKSRYSSKGYRVYGQQEVVDANPFSGSYYVDEGVYREHQTCDVKPGDILITLMGTVGRVLLIPKNAEPGIINPRLMRLSLDMKRVDPAFMVQVLSSLPIQRLLERRAQGGTMPGLNSEALSSLQVPVPPKDEQRRIAAVLQTWDEAVAACERLRSKKIEQTSWLRTNLLSGKVRLKGFSGDWRKVPLSVVLNEHGLRSSGTEEVFSVSVHKGLVNQIDHLGRSFAAKETAHYNRVLPGDIVYTKSPTGDFPLGIIKQSKLSHDVIVSPLYGVFTPITRDLGVILEAYFRSPITVRNYLSPLVQKGAKNTIAITNARFLEGMLMLPLDAAEQSAMAEIFEDADAELAAIERQIAAYQLQKRGLMQKLLTGQWRVRPESVDG